MMVLPEPGRASDFQLAFRQFRRLEGSFKLAADAKLESVQVKVYETGSDQVRATETVIPQ